jgi:signal transduction histidine kinase
MTNMRKIKERIKEHHRMHEELYREKEEWIKARRAEWEVGGRHGWGPYCPTEPWEHYRSNKIFNRPMRHWFFMKVFILFFWICVAFVVVQLFSNGSWSAEKIPHYLGWTFGIMLVAFFILRRMFGPLRMLMKGVKEISNGNLDFQFPMGRQHGEIYYLGESFNLMARRVKEMVHSKDQLLLDVSHELRSPLTRLKLSLEMTAENELKQSMLQDVSEMETMLAEILETERLRNGHGKLTFENIDLILLINEIITKYRGRRPGVELLDAPKTQLARVDSARIKIVVQNLLENALKFSNKQKQAVEVSLEATDEKVTLIVRDYGVGISLEDQDKIFEPFYRVDKSRTKETGGYGLGLSLCREIIRAHGGEIHLESQLGQGTRVFAEFPLNISKD